MLAFLLFVVQQNGIPRSQPLHISCCCCCSVHRCKGWNKLERSIHGVQLLFGERKGMRSWHAADGRRSFGFPWCDTITITTTTTTSIDGSNVGVSIQEGRVRGFASATTTSPTAADIRHGSVRRRRPAALMEHGELRGRLMIGSCGPLLLLLLGLSRSTAHGDDVRWMSRFFVLCAHEKVGQLWYNCDTRYSSLTTTSFNSFNDAAPRDAAKIWNPLLRLLFAR